MKASVERYGLVQTLKQKGAINDPAVEAAFLAIPRHRFLNNFYISDQVAPLHWKLIQPSSLEPDTWFELVYANAPHVIQLNEMGIPTSSSSDPEIMAQALEAATLAPGMHVMEIGTGTGYNAALLAHLVENPALVTTIEIDIDLAQQAKRCLDNVVGPGMCVVTGDGFQGYQPQAPYDRIIATASTQTIPLMWLDQLREGGIIVMHLPGHLGPGCILRFQKHGPGRSGSGQIIMRSSFMELQNSSVPAPVVPQLLSQLLAEGVTTKFSLSSDYFNPTLFWNEDLAFLLQTVFPKMYLMSIVKQIQDSPDLCLLDDQTRTLLIFSPNGEHQWSLEVRGEAQLWERVLMVYQQWVLLQRPVATAYRLIVDNQGKQILTIPSSNEHISAPTWVITNTLDGC